MWRPTTPANEQQIVGPVLTQQGFGEEDQALDVGPRDLRPVRKHLYTGPVTGHAGDAAGSGRHGLDQPLWPLA